MSAIADLPDLNVWLALASPTHQHHSSAVKYWEEQASQQVLFCTVTALGLVRLVIQPKLMGDAVLTAAEASALLETFVQQPGVSHAQPSSEGWDVFHGLMRQPEISPRLCTDAHLAALAITNQWRLVSFDRDFQSFPGLNLLQLR